MKTSNTAVTYQINNIKNKKRKLSIIIAKIKNTFEVIKEIANTIIIGKLKNIIKLKTILIFNINNKKYSFKNFLIFKITILADNHIDWKIHLFSRTISYFGNKNSIFNIILSKKIQKKV